MVNEMKVGTYIRGEESYVFKFYTDLVASKKLKFVNSVVNTIVDENAYNSIIRDLIFDYMIIQVFTDVDIEEIKNSPNMIDSIEDLLLETNIVEIVKANAFPTLFDELNKAVDDSIEYLTGVHKNPINDAISSLLYSIEKKMNEVDLNSMMGMAQKFADMTGELTPESIMNVYMNSDIHKQNLLNIEDARNRRAEIAENLDAAIKEVNTEAKVGTKAKNKK